MTELLHILSDWSVAAALRRPGIAYPLLSATHIFSLGVLIGSITVLDLRLLGLFRNTPVAVIAPLLSRVSAIGLLFAVVSGFLLFSVQPIEYVGNQAFLVKLVLIILGVVNAAILGLLPYWRQTLSGQPIHATVKIAALLSLTFWISTLIAGRWIGFL